MAKFLEENFLVEKFPNDNITGQSLDENNSTKEMFSLTSFVNSNLVSLLLKCELATYQCLKNLSLIGMSSICNI